MTDDDKEERKKKKKKRKKKRNDKAYTELGKVFLIREKFL